MNSRSVPAVLTALLAFTLPCVGQVPGFTEAGVVDVWNYRQGICPGGWVSIFGQNLAAAVAQWAPTPGGPLPTTLAGVVVRFNGIPAAIAAVSPTQLNVLVPGDIPIGSVTLTVERQGVASAPVSVQSVVARPAIYSLPEPGVSPLRFHVTAALAGTATLVGSRNVDGRVLRAAQPGDVIDLYAVGMGRTIGEFPTDRLFAGAYPLAALVRVRLGTQTLDPEFAGLVAPGLYMVRIQIPSNLPGGLTPISLDVGGLTSAPNVFLLIEQPQPFAVLESLTLSQTSVVGGSNVTAQVRLTGPAPAAGLTVALSSNNPAASVPPLVTVAPGSTALDFTVATRPVSAATTVTIRATAGTVVRTATLTVLPQSSASIFRNRDMRIENIAVTLQGQPLACTIELYGLVEWASIACLPTAPLGSVLVVIAFINPTFSPDSVVYSSVRSDVSNFTDFFVNPLGETVISGNLSLTASSSAVGTPVRGRLKFATLQRSFDVEFTGVISVSQLLD